MQILFIAFALLGLALPSAYSLALYPVALAAQYGLLTTLLDANQMPETKLRPTDALILTAGLRAIMSLMATKRVVINPILFLAVPAYVMIGVAWAQIIGPDMIPGHATQCLVTGVRFLEEFSILVIVAISVSNHKTALNTFRVVMGVQILFAGIQWFNLVGYRYGVTIGEVQGIERNVPRFFGPMGDSVGYFLIYGYIFMLQARRILWTGVFLGGILMTATLGAILSAAAATALSFLLGGTGTTETYHRIRYIVAGVLGLGIVGVVIAIWLPELFSAAVLRANEGGGGADQRINTMTVALNAITEHPILGIGYMGFAHSSALFGGTEVLGERTGSFSNANNQLLQVLLDAGIPGFLAIALFSWVAWNSLTRAANPETNGPLVPHFSTARIWFTSQIFGNLSSAWLIPSSSTAALLFVVIGLSIPVLAAKPKLLPQANPA